MNEFGDKVRDLRLKKALSQREVAERAGMALAYYNKVENGRLPPPSEDKIQRLSEILGTDVDELVLLALKVPKDIPEIIVQGDRKLAEFLRTARGLSSDQWDHLLKVVRVLKESGSEVD